ERICYQLRLTAATSIIFALTANAALTTEDIEFHRLLARIVQNFVDVGDLHWENFYSLGLSRHADQDYERAKMMYLRAKKSIEDDLNVRDQTGWQETVRILEQATTAAQLRRPLMVAL